MPFDLFFSVLEIYKHAFFTRIPFTCRIRAMCVSVCLPVSFQWQRVAAFVRYHFACWFLYTRCILVRALLFLFFFFNFIFVRQMLRRHLRISPRVSRWWRFRCVSFIVFMLFHRCYWKPFENTFADRQRWLNQRLCVFGRDSWHICEKEFSDFIMTSHIKFWSFIARIKPCARLWTS